MPQNGNSHEANSIFRIHKHQESPYKIRSSGRPGTQNSCTPDAINLKINARNCTTKYAIRSTFPQFKHIVKIITHKECSLQFVMSKNKQPNTNKSSQTNDLMMDKFWPAACKARVKLITQSHLAAITVCTNTENVENCRWRGRDSAQCTLN
jgi:hypothetical protein